MRLPSVLFVQHQTCSQRDPGVFQRAARIECQYHPLSIRRQKSVAGPLARYVAKMARDYVPLNPKRKTAGAERSARWRLFVNEKVESDL